jgi:hypothetical protein
VWVLGRRSALFIVSYAPLAAMFLGLRWPAGWDAADLAKLAVGVLAAAALAVGLFGVLFASGARTKVSCGTLAALGAAVTIVEDWTAPLTSVPKEHRTSATAAAIALFFVAAGVGLLKVILVHARRGTPRRWSIGDSRDQGASVAGYLASYLLPLLNPGADGVRTTVAYGVYFVTLYVVFMRTDGLAAINPTIYLFNYRVFDVEIKQLDAADTPMRVVLLARGTLKDVPVVEAVGFGDDCFVVVNKETV